jgi:hypothetical protein
MDQISTVGLRHPSIGKEKELVSGQVGMDQISTVGLRRCILRGVGGANIALPSEWTRSVRWDCDFLLKNDSRVMPAPLRAPNKTGGRPAQRAGRF